MISIREAKAIPRTSSSEWKNKFICVEGNPLSYCDISSVVALLMKVHVMGMFSEPFEQKNTARAVYEKSKFDAIKTRFTEVRLV